MAAPDVVDDKERTLRDRKHNPAEPRNAWKKKMGPEFSGFERTHDFLIAILAVAILVGLGMVIAFLSFG